jgi:hypothetical protein
MSRNTSADPLLLPIILGDTVPPTPKSDTYYLNALKAWYTFHNPECHNLLDTFLVLYSVQLILYRT